MQSKPGTPREFPPCSLSSDKTIIKGTGKGNTDLNQISNLTTQKVPEYNLRVFSNDHIEGHEDLLFRLKTCTYFSN